MALAIASGPALFFPSPQRQALPMGVARGAEGARVCLFVCGGEGGALFGAFCVF
jgi:hypothetical protein